jgi:integrase
VRLTGDQRRCEYQVVQKLLGHKSAVLTLDRYGHLFPDDLDAVAAAFDSAADALRTDEPPNTIRPGKNRA